MQASVALKDTWQTKASGTCVEPVRYTASFSQKVHCLQVPFGALPGEVGQLTEPSVPDLSEVFGQVGHYAKATQLALQ